MAGLFENILTNIKEKKQEGKLKTGYRFSDDGKLSVGGGYYDDDKMFEVEIGKDNANILFKKRFAKGGLAKPELQKLDSVFDEVNKRGLRPQIKKLFDQGYGAGTIAKKLSTGANKVLFEGSTGKSRMQRYLKKAKTFYKWEEPEFKIRNEQGVNLKDPKTIEKFQKIADQKQ